MRREIAKLLETGQEATARIRVYPIACCIFILFQNFKPIRFQRNLFYILFYGAVIYISMQVEHIIREENMMAAQEILELFCELVSVRLPIIESQRYFRD